MTYYVSKSHDWEQPDSPGLQWGLAWICQRFCWLWSTGCHDLCAMIEIHHWQCSLAFQTDVSRKKVAQAGPAICCKLFHFEKSACNSAVIIRPTFPLLKRFVINRFVINLLYMQSSMCQILGNLTKYPVLAWTSLIFLCLASMVLTDLVELRLSCCNVSLVSIWSDQIRSREVLLIALQFTMFISVFLVDVVSSRVIMCMLLHKCTSAVCAGPGVWIRFTVQSRFNSCCKTVADSDK